MTMVYRVKDPALLKQVKVGDKVTFEAEEARVGVHGDEDGEGEVGPSRSFRGARSASPESILRQLRRTMDSGFALRAPRNDGLRARNTPVSPHAAPFVNPLLTIHRAKIAQWS